MFTIAQVRARRQAAVLRIATAARGNNCRRQQCTVRNHSRPLIFHPPTRGVVQENKKMSEPMRKAIEEVKRLREEREAYQRDLTELAELKAHVLVVSDRLENLRWEHEILQQRYTNLVAERDALYDRFQTALHDVRQKSGFRSLLLEKRLAAAATEVERQTVTLSEVLVAARLDPRVLGRLEKQLGDVVGSKDAAIRELEGELERVAGAHDRLLEFFEGKLAEYGALLYRLLRV